MKSFATLALSLVLSTSGFAMVKLPADVTDDLLKTVAVDILINNINENYKVTKLTAGRIDDNGFEYAAGFITILKANGTCMKVAGAVRADTCTNIETNCKLDAYTLDCKEGAQDGAIFSVDMFKEAKKISDK